MSGNAHNGKAGGMESTNRLTVEWESLDKPILVNFTGGSLDVALNMCQQAMRELEARWRFVKSQQIQAETLRMAEDQRIAASIRKSI